MVEQHQSPLLQETSSLDISIDDMILIYLTSKGVKPASEIMLQGHSLRDITKYKYRQNPVVNGAYIVPVQVVDWLTDLFRYYDLICTSPTSSVIEQTTRVGKILVEIPQEQHVFHFSKTEENLCALLDAKDAVAKGIALGYPPRSVKYFGKEWIIPKGTAEIELTNYEKAVLSTMPFMVETRDPEAVIEAMGFAHRYIRGLNGTIFGQIMNDQVQMAKDNTRLFSLAEKERVQLKNHGILS